MTEPTPSNVDIGARVTELLEGFDIPHEACVSYSWTHGYEQLTVEAEGVGNIHFAGAHHPNGHCEGGGVCTWCGRTLNYD